MKERIALLEERLAAYEAPEEESAPEEEPAVDFTDIDLSTEEDSSSPSAPQDDSESTPVTPTPLSVTPDEADETPAVTLSDIPIVIPSESKESHKPLALPQYPWQTDRPGLPVKNIRSGISLLDRAMFVNTLFGEDPQLYANTIADLNEMEDLETAVDYIAAHFPDWDLRSDAVYHFMMSIRKKLG